MQLTLLILVLYCNVQNSISNPPRHQDATWRPSRYIIDNRRNVLFSKKPLTALIQQPQDYPPKESATFARESFRQSLFPVERFHKDLTAEASFSEPKFYRKYGENSLPRKIVKSYKVTGGLGNHPDVYKYNVGVFENQQNTSRVIDPHNFIQNEDEVLIDVDSKLVTTTEKISWEPKNSYVSMPPAAATSKSQKNAQVSSQTIQEFQLNSPTTTSYSWDLTNGKTEEGNQIDSTNEKHVYETRIETVSYHQEVIFNPSKKQNWYREDPEEKPKNFESSEKNYEEPEKDYEHPEENYEDPEKDYEHPEENYEDPEKNYELNEAVNVMSEGRIYSPESEENRNKFGYVVEGTNYKKYRVEERTPDGFIVGEYGVVSHDDGSLRGVRYTADGNTNPKLIYETLIKFLSL